jgi:leader peptidase (prepilin peptidase) / N-methyltransferase
MPDLNLIPPVFGYVVAGVFGAVIGSFLNVVIHRVPHEQSIVFPNSRCPSCGSAIAFYDNIPIASYLVLGGKCRSCKEHISIRYPAVELLTAALFVLVAWHDGLSPALPFDLIFTSALIALMFIDAKHKILPDVITLPGIGFALIARIILPYLTGTPHFDDIPSLSQGVPGGLPRWALSLVGAFIGGLIGGGSLWLMGWVWEKVRNVEAMGLGDVKMMFMVGAYLGWRLTILTIFLGVLSGSLYGIYIMVVEGKYDGKAELPFGIFLGLGAIAALLFGHPIVEWYAGQFR